MRYFLVPALGVGLLCLFHASQGQVPRERKDSAAGYRSPTHLVLLPDGRRALTANHTADTVSLVDINAGKVLAEVPCGRRPVAVACSPDGKRAAVSNLWSATVTLFDVEQDSLRRTGAVEVGNLPRSLVFAPDGRALYVAVAGDDVVVQVNLADGKIEQRWPAAREPRVLALSPDGKWLAAAASRSGLVYCWNRSTGKQHWQRRVEGGFNLHGLSFAPDSQSLVCAHNIRRAFSVSRGNIDNGWAMDSRLIRFAVDDKATPNTWKLALDTRGEAVGDPEALGWTPDGKRLVIAAGGTHELLRFRTDELPWNIGDPGDFIDPFVVIDEARYRRLPAGARPMAVAFTPDSKRAVVADYLGDAVQVIDLDSGKMRGIGLGGPLQPTAERRGEAIFYDARRSHHQWFSCNTCHPDGHTCGIHFDTLNDDSYGNPKLTPTLRNVAATAPYTWHGWQKELSDAVAKSLTDTMFGPEPTKAEVRDVVAYLKTLEHPPRAQSRRGNADEVRRGAEIFAGKAGCARCHQGPNFTSKSNYELKIGEDGSPFTSWNPPSLRGLWDRGPYFHDGRADTLEELLDAYHRPENLGGDKISSEEQRALVTFLKSLD